MTLVSVIIPCYNVEEYIHDCIESVLKQSYNNIEIICIDNNSKDSTWQILLNLKEKFANLIIDKELKAGACAARNKGLTIAAGEWIQFLDADDLLLPTKIEHQMKIVCQNPNVSLVAAFYKRRLINGTETIPSQIHSNKFIASFINQCGNTCSNIWHKKALIEVGCWDESLESSQETDLMLRLFLNNNNFAIDEEPLTIIRERETGQISQRNPAKKWEQYITTRLNYLAKLKENYYNIYSKNRNLYYDFLLVSIIILSKYDKGKAINIYHKKIIHEQKFSLKYVRSSLIKLIGLNLFLKIKATFRT